MEKKIVDNQFKEHTFHAGICMAGAVSAGAYTAGVIDYLLEALEHWEKAKSLSPEQLEGKVPRHHFSIEVLGGASAGGMTAAVTAAAVQRDFRPVKQSDLEDEKHEEHEKQNPLYNSWVNLTEIPGKDMMDLMLCTDDIESDLISNKNKEVRAGLNSTFISQIAKDVMEIRVKETYPRPYFANDLDIFTTITNLRGFNFNVKFTTSAGVRQHRMKMYRDYAFFKVSESEYGNDGRIPVNFKSPGGMNTEILAQAAMSTGAFPVGLESRELTRKHEYIKHNKYLNLRLSNSGVDDKSVEYTFLPEGDFLSLNVDGGVINNEPFEITQELLNDRRTKAISIDDNGMSAGTPSKGTPNYSPETSASLFDSLVLMVDPFPDDEEDTTVFTPRKAWRHVVPSVLGAMRGQLLMKDEQIKRAYLNDDYTRFLIMPVRTVNGVEKKYSIACGSLGGFGGFFSKSFRRHDFFLGRRNCQRFLQAHFSAPADANNPILAWGYKDVNDFTYTDSAGRSYLPLIPDLRLEQLPNGTYRVVKPAEEKEYPYPAISLKYILSLEDKIEKRIKCILDNIQNSEVETQKSKTQSPILEKVRKKTWTQKLGARLSRPLANAYISIGKWKGRSIISKTCVDAIIVDMEKRELLKDDF